MPDTTAKYAIPKPQTSDFVNSWPATQRAATDWLDANIAVAITTTPRPAAGLFGRLHRAADGTISFDTGTTWVEIPSGSVAARLQSGAVDPLTVTATMIGADVPMVDIGVQLPTASSVLPANGKFAWCDGSLIRADLYPVFAANVGNAYNGGVNPGLDGGGHQLVKLPNKAGRVSIGAGAGVGLTNRVRGVQVGAEAVALIEANLAPHIHYIHTWQDNTANVNYTVGMGDLNDSGGQAATTSAGSGTPHANVQPSEVDNWIVRIA